MFTIRSIYMRLMIPLAALATITHPVSAAPLLKAASTAEGGYFDPHSHLTGILRFKVNAIVTKIAKNIPLFDQVKSSVSLLKLASEYGNKTTVKIPGFEKLPNDDKLWFLFEGYLADAMPQEVTVTDELRTVGQNLLRNYYEALYEKHEAEMKEYSTTKRREDISKTYLGLLGRAESGSNRLFRLLEECKPTENKPQEVENLLQQMLVASPEVDYDSAYVARGLLDLEPKAYARATVLELKRQKIEDSEQSLPIGWWTESLLDQPAESKKFLYELQEQAKNFDIKLRWLPMIQNGMISLQAQAGPIMIMRAMNRWSIEPDRCGWEQFWPDKSVPNQKELTAKLEKMLEDPNVIGFDIGGQERSCYGSGTGASNLREYLRVAFKVAQAKSKRLVAHVHAGEGFAILDDKNFVCEMSDNTKLKPLDVHRDRAGMPIHYQRAEENLDAVLDAVQAVREGIKDPSELDRYIEIRIGHATHATRSQAVRMAALHLWADVNLSSNLATGALRPGDNPNFFSVVNGVQMAGGGWSTGARKIVEYLADEHSLANLMQAGVRVMIGTDSGGVEQSRMESEYRLAGDVLSKVLGDRINPTEALKHQLSLDRFYENQKAHQTFIESGPTDTASSSAMMPRASQWL